MPKKKSTGAGSGRGKKSRPDTEAALQRELKREKAEGKGVVGDMGKNDTLSGSSTWTTLKPPSGKAPRSKGATKAVGSGATDPAARDRARVRDEIADRLRHRGVRLLRTETPEELGDLLDAVEAFERAVEAKGGDLMVDEPATPTADVPEDQRRFMLPRRRDNEAVAAFIGRIREAARRARK